LNENITTKVSARAGTGNSCYFNLGTKIISLIFNQSSANLSAMTGVKKMLKQLFLLKYSSTKLNGS